MTPTRIWSLRPATAGWHTKRAFLLSAPFSICPILYLPLFINDAIPEEHKNGIDMRRDMLRRSHVLVVCGGEVDEDVKNDIAVAKRLNITATTLDGILTVNQQGRHDV